MGTDPQAFFARWIKALNEFDFATLEAMVDPDLIFDLPQSGERIRGFQNWRTQIESYPGGLATGSTDAGSAGVIEEPDRWAISPGYTVVRMSNPDRLTTTVRVVYPDGTHWWVVTSVEMRAERVYRLMSFFAPEMPAPLAETIGRTPPG